jgi:hypothetical protein
MVLSGSEWLWGMSVETWLQIVALTVRLFHINVTSKKSTVGPD